VCVPAISVAWMRRVIGGAWVTAHPGLARADRTAGPLRWTPPPERAEVHSEFTFTIPIASGEAAAAPGDHHAPGSRRRVLVVDDNVDAAESLAELLRVLGHEVTVAYDGATAVKLALRDLPDAVLCDIGLPGMDGYEVARTLRRNGALAKALLVAVSGYASDDDVKRAVAAGYDRHLAKPADPFELERLVG
jgi:CheY-like chemotaxis protein